MAERTCLNCVYVRCDPREWLRRLARGEPLVPMCANHPQWPGQLREVPGTPCRNYRPKLPEPGGDVMRIPMDNGLYALVDAADYEWLNQYKWSRCGAGYAGRYEKGKVIYMHRQIMQAPKGVVVDHIDGNRANNSRSNLRLCTCSENGYNNVKRIGSASRFKGVFRRKKDGRWYAMVFFRGKYIWLGFFDDEVEAARAFDRKAVELGIVFARLNFPEEWPPERRQEVYAKHPDPAGKRTTDKPEPKREAAATGAKTPTSKINKLAKPTKTRRAKSNVAKSRAKADKQRTEPAKKVRRKVKPRQEKDRRA